jgi:UDP-3-O-[3-hydroxymyristoyl] glucosamine N-acyltransferase
MDQCLIIIGNSSAARECYWLAREIWGDGLHFKGFLSFEGYAQNLKNLTELQIGDDESFRHKSNDVIAIGIGHPKLRFKAYRKWRARGATFINIIHPTSKLREDTKVGEANILTSDCHISCNCCIGNANYLNGGVILGHDVTLGDGNFLAPYTVILGDTTIGSMNAFGVNSVVLADTKIGDENVIAPGAYIYKGCGNNSTMAGNPALRIDQ